MVVEPMLWLALASLVYGSQVLSAADLWRRGRPLTVGAGRSAVRIGDRERGVALGFQDAFFGDLNDKYLPTFSRCGWCWASAPPSSRPTFSATACSAPASSG